MPVKNNLSASLKALGWTQGELARRLNVHPNTVSAWARDVVAVTGPARAYIELAIKVVELGDLLK